MTSTRPTLALTGVVAVPVLAAGCGAGGDRADAVPETATGGLEHLAALSGCDPNMQTDADEIRQALCTTGEGRYVLATFATDRGQAEWLGGAKDYGGYYLVGRGWVAVGREGTVTALQGTLGGTVQEGSAHMNGGGSHHHGDRESHGVGGRHD